MANRMVQVVNLTLWRKEARKEGSKEGRGKREAKDDDCKNSLAAAFGSDA